MPTTNQKVKIDGKIFKIFLKKGNLNPRVHNAIISGKIPPIPRYVLNKKTKELIPIHQGNSNKISKEFRNIKRKANLVLPTNTFYDMKTKRIINRKKIFTEKGIIRKEFKNRKIVNNRIIIERKKKKIINKILVSYTLKAEVIYIKGNSDLEFEKKFYPYSTTRTFETTSDKNLNAEIEYDINLWIMNYYTEGIIDHKFNEDPTDMIKIIDIQTQIIPQTQIEASDFLLNSSTPLYIDVKSKEEWNTGENKCVYDFIMWRYGKIKGCIKICKFEKLWELFNGMTYNPPLSEDDYYNQNWLMADYNKYNTEYYDSETGEIEEEENDSYGDYLKRLYGVNVKMLKKFCDYLAIPMYALNQDDKIIEYFYPKYRRDDYKIPPLCYIVANKHLYPVMDEGKV